jgi:thiol-disulfide isomerase/thioredoxin
MKKSPSILTFRRRILPAILTVAFAGAISVSAEDKPAASGDDAYKARIEQVKKDIQGKLQETHDVNAALTVLEQDARALLKDFPGKPDPYAMLLEVASNGGSEKGKAIAEEITKADAAPPELKEQAQGLLKKLDALGKPVDIQFTAVDGRPVNVKDMKGKVILIDFWATWCGPCVGELPHVKEAYEKLHDKGFEIVGLSFDQDKSALEGFVKEKGMAWPQYFDGEGWGNKFGKQYGIESIPAMWLIDKKGNLRDMNARGDLQAKAEKLLAEQ